MISPEGGAPISTIKNIHSIVNKIGAEAALRKENGGDNPILEKGVHITQDALNSEVIFTFLGIDEEGRHLTLVYDEFLQQFTSRYSFTPQTYISNENILLSTHPNKELVYIHNEGNWGEFYDEIEEAHVSLVLNDNADLNKVLRFIEFNSIVRDDNKVIDRTQTITAFKVTTEYQTTDKVPFSPSRVKRKFDKWRLKIPRDQATNNRNRLRSSHFVLTLYFDNTYNKELILNRLMYYYDIQTF
jgi:hypothetical protein